MAQHSVAKPGCPYSETIFTRIGHQSDILIHEAADGDQTAKETILAEKVQQAENGMFTEEIQQVEERVDYFRWASCWRVILVKYFTRA